MRNKLNCAVIGTGSIGLDHLKSLASHPGASLVAMAEQNAALAKQVARRFSLARSYADYHELLQQPDIEAVTIALPNHLHAPAAVAALQAGKHVMLEKPLAIDAKHARQIVAAAQRSQRVCTVGMNFRFNRHTQSAVAAVARGDLGDVYHTRCFWLRRQGIPRIGSWFTQKGLAGGGCGFDLGVHMIDSALYLMGDFDVIAVSALTHDRLGRQGIMEMNWGKSPIAAGKPFDVEDYCVALLRMKSGRSISVEIGWAGFQSPTSREYGIELLGDRGGLSLFPAQLYRMGRRGYESIELESGRSALPENRIHHFVDCVIQGKAPLVTMTESLKVQNVLDAIYASAERGREVAVKH